MDTIHIGTIGQMSEPILCPSCSASNPPGASWCSLCFTPFGTADPESDALVTNSPQPTREDRDPTAPQAAPPPPVRAEGEQLALLDGEYDKTWTCRFCETHVPVGDVQCPACQQTIYDSFGGRAPEIVVDPVEALRRSAIPGGGHFALQQGVTAITILVITVISLGMGVYLLISGVVVYGAVLLFVGVTIWGLAAHDAFRMASGHGSEIFLRPRVLSVVMGLWFVVIIAAARSAQQVINQ